MNSSTIPILSIHILNPNDKHREQLIKTDTKEALQVTHMPPDPGGIRHIHLDFHK